MRRSLGVIGAGFAMLGGCAPPKVPPTTPPAPIAQRAALRERPTTSRVIAASAAPATASESDVIARVGTRTITKDQLLAPMLEAHGLGFLLHLVQLELARQAAAQQGVVVTAADIKHERELTFQRMFKDSDEALKAKLKEAKDKGDNEAVEKITRELNIDREPLLDQYLAQQYSQSRQYVSRQEFNLVLEVNTYLRKIVEASPDVKKSLTEDTLQKAFAAQYGEKVVVRHIQANNSADLQAAKNRLNKGENFADVAKELSANKNTAPLGGAIPPFTMNATNVPDVFKKTAFSLKNGEVSDPVLADNAYHLIKVENRIAPKIVKYEDVKESLRADLFDKVLQAYVKQLRDKLARQTQASLQIENPVLKAQFDKRLEEGKVRQGDIDEAMKRDRAARNVPEDLPQPGEPPTTEPVAAPAAPPVVAPANPVPAPPATTPAPAK